jgi:DNA-binding PadR family transcriptional regulator
MDDKLLLLGMLRQHQMHGYQLFEFIERDMSTCIDLKKPTAYYLLNRMAQDGWVEERQEQEGNRPPRKVYRLTGQGEAAFQRLLRENLAAYLPPGFAGDIGLAFMDTLEPAEALDLLRQRQAAIAAALSAVEAAPQHQGSLQWLVEHQLFHLKSELAWLEGLLERLETANRSSHPGSAPA